MARFMLKRRLAATLTAAALTLSQTSCGTVLHPERRGQPGGPLDPAIVALDAVGLILFFVPGIVAFAVDFSNGTIYLPPERSVYSSPAELRTIRMSPAELTPQRLEAVVQQHTGQTIQLAAGAYRATKLERIDDFSSGAWMRVPSGQADASVIFPGRPE
jgi:hypothetical protein